MYSTELDEVDKKILEIIADNARCSYSEIGEKVGVSRVTVQKRMKELENKGIIKGYKTIISEANPENEIRFYAEIEARPEEFEKVVDSLVSMSFNKRVYTSTGECHLHVEGEAPNQAAFSQYVNGFYKKMEGVKRITIHQIITIHKS